MDIRNVFNQMMVLFIMLVVGYGCSKFGVVDKEGNKFLTRFTLVVPQGCMVLSSVINIDFEVSVSKIIAVFLSGFMMYTVLLLIGFLVMFLLRRHEDTAGLFGFMTVFGNVGFLGFPVVNSLFGSQALFYAALFLVPFNLLAYSIGPLLITGQFQKHARPDWKACINPVTIVSLFSIVLLFLHPKVPAVLDEAIGRMGDTIVPLSMMIIGTSLGDIPLKDVFGDWRCYVFSAVKLLAVPFCFFYVMKVLVHDSLVLGTMTVLSATPVAAVAVMLSIQKGGDARLASKTVFLSTVFSVLTIPVVCWALL